MRKFEFHAYPADENGDIAAVPTITTVPFEEAAQAKAHAGKLAKQCGGAVDIARIGDRPWSSRYLTTAMPSEFHAKGYRLERIRH